MEIWNQVDLSQWNGKAGEAPKAVKKEFTYADLATGDDEMRANAIDWLKAHAKDANPFFMYLCFLKVHNPNNPSPRFKGQIARRRQLSRRSDGARRQYRPGDAGDPRSRPRREYARGVDHRQRRLDRRLARCRLHALPRHEGLLLRGRLPRAGHRLVARQDQAGTVNTGYVVAHGLVADFRQARRARAAATRLEGQ